MQHIREDSSSKKGVNKANFSSFVLKSFFTKT